MAAELWANRCGGNGPWSLLLLSWICLIFNFLLLSRHRNSWIWAKKGGVHTGSLILGVPKLLYLCHSLRYAHKIDYFVWAVTRVPLGSAGTCVFVSIEYNTNLDMQLIPVSEG